MIPGRRCMIFIHLLPGFLLSYRKSLLPLSCSYNIEMLQKIKSYMMPIAMITGGLFYEYVSVLSFCMPYLIAIMLFITYCNISLRDIRISRLHFWLLIIQIIGSITVYLLLVRFNPIIAQGAMICILAPTATSAPVIAGMLGGNMASLATYSLLSNMTVAFIAPIVFAWVGNADAASFGHSVIAISQNVVGLLLLPFVCALILKKVLPRVHDQIRKKKDISFYMWSVALTIVTGKTLKFIIEQESPNYMTEISIAAVALIVCVTQFLTGRRLGRIYNDTVAGGQGLGQKNTVLAIWMAQTYLNPISSIGPGSYVLWQNLVNSYQVWRKRASL